MCQKSIKAIFSMALFLSGCTHLDNMEEDNSDNNQIVLFENMDTELLIDKKNIFQDPENYLSNLSFNVLYSFRKRVPIKLENNNVIDDYAQASRFYNNYENTISCTVVLNTSQDLDKTSKKNPMIKAGFTSFQIKEFIYLHELAHCLDGELPIKDVDPIAWREALADGYASYIMYNHGLLSKTTIVRFAKLRMKTNEDGGAGNMQLFIDKNLDKIDQSLKDPLDILNEIKKLRYKMYKIRDN